MIGHRSITANKREISDPRLIQISEVFMPILLALSFESVTEYLFSVNSGTLGYILYSDIVLQNLLTAGVKAKLLIGIKLIS